MDAHELRARITAGERIVRMQRELSEKNRLVRVTLDELQRIHDQLDRDLLDAKQLQQSLVPDRYRRLPQGTLSLLLDAQGKTYAQYLLSAEVTVDTGLVECVERLYPVFEEGDL